ncbi:MAG: hypothetical protein GC162_07165 [Planctomycetes bacterium]|nr:hypothetical protein [Planctomycetota bacterium]
MGPHPVRRGRQRERRLMRARAFIAICAAAIFAGCATTKPLPKPAAIDPPPPSEIHAAIDRGVTFLLDTQNKDGSWGTPTKTKELNIYAPIPGAHQAFRAAVTSMCISALIDTGKAHEPAVAAALDRAEAWLFKELPHVKRANTMALYNNWTHTYSIQALVRLRTLKPDDASRRQIIDDLVASQIDRLTRYEYVDGGWGYYDFYQETQRPGSPSDSFVTAAVMVALREAQDAGYTIPPRLIERGLGSIEHQRKPDNTYLYSGNFDNYPMRPINRPPGSLGRSQACNAALRLWGDTSITDDILKTWLDRLFARNGWLSNGRKRPVPHEAPFQVAGYFFYFGHYYAGFCIDALPPTQRPFYQDHLARVLLTLQEKDGSWWDFPFYNYHQQYGTAFALMTLTRCEHDTGVPVASK